MCPPRPASSRKGGFTLVEMLTVVGILAVLFAIISLSLSSSSDGQNMRLAVDEIRSAMRYARTYAGANNTEVSLIFAHDPSRAAGSATFSDMYSGPRAKVRFLRAYSVYSHRDESLIMEWKQLPPGVVLETSHPKENSGNLLSDNVYLESIPKYVVTDNPADTALIRMVALKFMPSGSLTFYYTSATAAPKILVTAGSTDGDNPAATNPTVLYQHGAKRGCAGMMIYGLTGETRFIEQARDP